MPVGELGTMELNGFGGLNMQRLGEDTKFVLSLTPLARAVATVNGALGGTSGWIDTAGFDEATVNFIFGAIDATATPIDAAVYENDSTSGNGTKITGSDIVQMAGGDDDDSISPVSIRLGGRANRKRYIRPQIVAGGSGNFTAGITVLLSNPEQAPVTNSPAVIMV